MPRYSDPSVWGGSFMDEVRLLTAMKLYLKQIKRHFPQLDSCFFQLAQVLHLTTERWSEQDRCANTFLHVFGKCRRQRGKESFLFVSSQSLWCQLADFSFSFLIKHFCFIVLPVDKDPQNPTWGELHQRDRNSLGLWRLQTLIVSACLHTCSGFTARLVNPSQDFKRWAESPTFTHPFTPCRQPAAQVRQR